jgi:tripartite-type tricarboxylate transporter receptor subunit TctC
MITRRSLLRAVAISALALTDRVALAQSPSWPTRFVRIVVPFPPGGATDAAARLLAARLSEVWGQQVVIENRAGAGGNIAAQSVVQSEPDGYTLYFPSVGHATNKFIYKSLTYDPVADFAPISLLCVFPNIMVVPNTLPVNSVQEFIALAKTKRMSYASSGNGTSLHLTAELFKRSAGIELTHIPYRGAGPAITDLLAGRTDVIFGNVGSMVPLIEQQQARGLAVTSLTRLAAVPTLPPMADVLPGFDVSSWYALFAPRKTPPEIIAKIHRDSVEALSHPSVKAKLDQIGAMVAGSTPAQLAAFLDAEMKRWEPVIRDSGIRAE